MPEPNEDAIPPRPYRVGVDTGGTFTDLVLVDPTGRIVTTHKRLSTPHDPSIAVLDGIDTLLAQHGQGLTRADVRVTHGSTVATNALLEADHGATVFVTTAGFEDTLQLARQHRPELYALIPRRPDPPVQRENCVGVRERLGHDGRVIEALTGEAIRQAVSEVIAKQPDAVAVSLLHSYANPTHEQQLAAALRDALDDAVHLTVSHELLPEFREYERASACVINAVVAPKMTRYLRKLSTALGENALRIMGSHGGTVSVEEACREPVRTILSGPAGGVRGAAALGQSLITLDMGGTSTDVAVIDAEPTRSRNHEAGGLPVPLPMVDIHTVGAGGGSIASLDAGGALRVGPRSAGADPGPACYGRQTGDPLVTVTDAHVFLGHLPDHHPLGDGLRVQKHHAVDAIEHLARQSGMSTRALAEGVLRIAELNMARAVHRVTLQRGKDPRGYTLVPFGGAGGLHACGLAEQLGIQCVLLPAHPGLLSAVGMLAAPPRRIATRSILWTYKLGADPSPVHTLADQLAVQAGSETKTSVQLTYEHNYRYCGQSHEITIAYADRHDPANAHAKLIERFHAEHEKLFGYRDDDRPVELVSMTCIADGPAVPVSASIPTASGDERGPQESSDFVPRASLPVGSGLAGPLVVTEYSATTLVREGWTVMVRDDGALLLERDA